MVKDLYSILGVSKESNIDEIRKAFRTQAMKWHPDKTPIEGHSDDEIEVLRERYEKKYLELQQAYKVLANPKAREQYNQSQQKDFNDLGAGAQARQKRDASYNRTDKYQTVDDNGKKVHDVNQFNADFNKTRSGADTTSFNDLHKKYNKTTVVKKSDVDELYERRELEKKMLAEQMNTTMHAEGHKFDVNQFNRVFDQQKRDNPTATGLQVYGQEPTGLFSGATGITELGDTNLNNNGVLFGNQVGTDTLVGGTSINLNKDFDTSKYRTSDSEAAEYVSGSVLLKEGEDMRYNSTKPVKQDDLMARVLAAKQDRERLMRLDEGEFINKATEVEQQYGDLYEVNNAAMDNKLESRSQVELRKQKQH